MKKTSPLANNKELYSSKYQQCQMGGKIIAFGKKMILFPLLNILHLETRWCWGDCRVQCSVSKSRHTPYQWTYGCGANQEQTWNEQEKKNDSLLKMAVFLAIIPSVCDRWCVYCAMYTAGEYRRGSYCAIYIRDMSVHRHKFLQSLQCYFFSMFSSLESAWYSFESRFHHLWVVTL